MNEKEVSELRRRFRQDSHWDYPCARLLCQRGGGNCLPIPTVPWGYVTRGE